MATKKVKTADIKIEYCEQKYTALRLFLGQKDISFDNEMVEFIDKLYEKNVPKDVKIFIENTSGNVEDSNKNSQGNQNG